MKNTVPEVAREQFIDALVKLGAARLSELLGHDTAQRLSELGIPFTARSAADFLISQKGPGVFDSEALRLEVLQTVPRVRVEELLGEKSQLGSLLVSWNRFKWGSNSKSRDFLGLLGISDEVLREAKPDRNAILELKTASPLHDYQAGVRREILTKICAARDGEGARFIVHMPTGAGKTRTAVEAVLDVCRMQRASQFTVVWFAHSDELCEQACEAIERTWRARADQAAKLVKLWGGRRCTELEVDRPVVVVTSFQSAYRMLTSNDTSRFSLFSKIRRCCAVLIVDEAHQSTAPTYREAIEQFSVRSTHIIGLTATPGRHGVNQEVDATVELARFYRDEKVTMRDQVGEIADPISYLVSHGVLSSMQREKLHTHESFILSDKERSDIEASLDIPQSALQEIGASASRTILVASHAAKYVADMEASVLVFSPSKQNAIDLAAILDYKGILSRAITGETSQSDREAAITSFKEGRIPVLTNFGVLTTGFDAPNVGVVIVARPTTSVILYSQMVGRGLRGPAMGGTEKCLVVDVIDNIANMPEAADAFRFFDDFYGG